MKTIASVVATIITRVPFVEEGLAQGLINLSQLSRQIKPDIENVLDKPVQIGAIVMALKRLAPQIVAQSQHFNAILGQIQDITIKSNLVSYTFDKSSSTHHALDLLSQHKELFTSHFFTYTQGISETCVMADATFRILIEQIFSEQHKVLEVLDISSMTIRLPASNVQMPGVYYAILKLFAWNNINLTDMVSTANELTLLMEDRFIDSAFSLLKKHLRLIEQKAPKA